MRRFIALMGCIALVALVAGCGGGDDGTSGSTVADSTESSQDSSPIVIGAAVGQTGFMQAYDGAPTEALKLAVKERNAAGGIDGRKIDLRIKDTASDRAKAKTVANELVSEGAELVVVSCDFDFGAPAAQVAQQAGKMTMSLCAQSLKFGVQGIGPLAFTPAASAVDEGAATAEWALEQKWDSTFVLEDPTTAYTEEACSGFKDRYVDKGGSIAGEAAFKNEDPSIATQIGDIKAVQSKVDFIRMCSYPPGSGTAIRQIRAAGIDLPIVGVGAMDGTYWLEAIPNISELYYPTAGSIYGDDPNPEVNKVVSEYEAATKGEPANAYVLFGHALLELYAQGVEAAGSSDPDAVAAAMSEFKEVPSLVGATTYTDEIHIALDRPWVFIKVTNGKPAYLETFTASEPAPFELG